MLKKNAAKTISSGLAKKQKHSMKDKLIKKWDMVLKEDRISPEEMVNYVQKLIDVENNVSNPQDYVKMIFDKITAWKKKNNKSRDSEQLEQFIHKSLKVPRKANGAKVKIHNAKTAFELLKRLQSDIKLTEDELAIMVYTSVDQEHFTHLLIE